MNEPLIRPEQLDLDRRGIVCQVPDQIPHGLSEFDPERRLARIDPVADVRNDVADRPGAFGPELHKVIAPVWLRQEETHLRPGPS